MAARLLRILVVEDEFLIALDLQEHLTELGHVCVGPAATVATGLELAGSAIDAAILNVVLAGEVIDPVCEVLIQRRIPFAFASEVNTRFGDRWASYPRVVKPYAREDIEALVRLLSAGRSGQ